MQPVRRERAVVPALGRIPPRRWPLDGLPPGAARPGTEPGTALTAERVTAFGTRCRKRTLEQQRHVAESDTLIDELRQASVVVLGLPMYNFGVPSTLKAYFDQRGARGA